MGKEAKIGLAVILVLVICLAVVLVKRLASGEGGPQTASSEERNHDPAGAHGDAAGRDSDASPTLAPSSRPTIVAARNKSGQAGRGQHADLGQWSGASDDTQGKQAGGGARGLPPSLMPNPRQGYPADAYDRYGSAYERPKSEKGGEAEAADSAANERTRDPFRGRTTLYPPSESNQGNRSPNNTLRMVDPPDPEPRPSGAGGYVPTGAGRPPGGYAPYDSATRTPPGYGHDARRSLDSPRMTPEAARPHPGSGARFGAVSTATRSSVKDGRRDDGTYEVQPNDNYWTIAEKVYGTGAYFKALAEHNRKKVPQEDQLQVGDVVSTPELEKLEKSYPDLCPKASHRDVVQRQPATVSTHQYSTGRTYVTAEGDTLFDIARTELGKAARWSEIYDLNRDQIGPDYNYLRPGLQLVMPEGESPGKLTHRPGTEPAFRR